MEKTKLHEKTVLEMIDSDYGVHFRKMSRVMSSSAKTISPQKTSIARVVIEVVMCQEKPIDLQRP